MADDFADCDEDGFGASAVDASIPMGECAPWNFDRLSRGHPTIR
jgi:hypothetical protein